MIKKMLLFLFFLPLLAHGQNFPQPNYPQNYFTKPVHIPILLAGNFGELRPGHFHEGLDIKTRGVTGYRVYAAADGYISRVAVSHVGFGHVIYITHPNGYTTVYGHLNRFNNELAAYVKAQQYKQESWRIDLSLAPALFPVKKDEYIALSGATGSVAGPHVHFEIRDTKSEHPLNGQLFGFDIKDNIPPRVYRIALYDRNRSIYEQTPKILLLHAKGDHHSPSGAVVTVQTDRVGFGVQTIDHQNNTHNTYGVYQGLLYVDGDIQNGFQLDNIGYEETRYVDAHYDYKTYIKTRRHFELLFELPGNHLPIYYNFQGDGTVDLSDGETHPIKIVIKDAAGNASTIKLKVKKAGKSKQEKTDCSNQMYPGTRNIFENKSVQFFLSPGSLYDDICFQYQDIPVSAAGYYSDIQRIHNEDVPLYKYFTLRLKLSKSIPNDLKDKLVLVRKNKKGTTKRVTAAAWDNGWVEATVRSFGDYAIQVDTQPPSVTALNIRDGANLAHAKTIKFRISDRKSGIRSYRAELDGKWLMFARKGSTIFYTFDEQCPAGEHTLTLTVSDGVGNTTTKTYHFKR